jgi:hypothetical protein
MIRFENKAALNLLLQYLLVVQLLIWSQVIVWLQHHSVLLTSQAKLLAEQVWLLCLLAIELLFWLENWFADAVDDFDFAAVVERLLIVCVWLELLVTLAIEHQSLAASEVTQKGELKSFFDSWSDTSKSQERNETSNRLTDVAMTNGRHCRKSQSPRIVCQRVLSIAFVRFCYVSASSQVSARRNAWNVTLDWPANHEEESWSWSATNRFVRILSSAQASSQILSQFERPIHLLTVFALLSALDQFHCLFAACPCFYFVSAPLCEHERSICAEHSDKSKQQQTQLFFATNLFTCNFVWIRINIIINSFSIEHKKCTAA